MAALGNIGWEMRIPDLVGRNTVFAWDKKESVIVPLTGGLADEPLSLFQDSTFVTRTRADGSGASYFYDLEDGVYHARETRSDCHAWRITVVGQAVTVESMTPGSVGAVYDAFWSDVRALLHFEGPNNSTVFTDETGRVWTAAGNAKISTATPLMDLASGLFDGAGDYLYAAHDGDLSVSAGDVTIEALFTIASAKTHTISDKRSSSSAQEHSLSVSAAGIVTFSAFAAGSPVVTIASTTAIALNTPVAVAATRQGSLWRLFINGTLEASATQSGAPSTNSDPLRIGRDGFDSSRDLDGRVDEYRFTRRCRYTASYTPTLEAFPAGPPLGGGGSGGTHAYGFVS